MCVCVYGSHIKFESENEKTTTTTTEKIQNHCHFLHGFSNGMNE